MSDPLQPRLPVALKAYYDGSGQATDKQTPFVTLAGYAAPPDTWTRFEREWGAILAGDGSRPSCGYLHMVELFGPKDDPENEYLGWSDDHKTSLLHDVYDCLYNLGWNRALNFRGLICTVSKDDYVRACDALPHLAELSVESICIDHVGMWAVQMIPNDPSTLTGKAGSVEFWFDQNEPFRGALMPRWNTKWHKRDEVLKCIAAMPEADMRTVRPLQAADYLAWLTNRYRCRQDPTSQFRRILSAPFTEQFYGYDALLKTYQKPVT